MRLCAIGLLLGLFWESLNWGSARGWVYTVPFFEEGKLKHASFAGLEGADAFYALLRLREGEFAIEHGVAAPAETVTERLEYLLMEGMRLMDEEKRGDVVS